MCSRVQLSSRSIFCLSLTLILSAAIATADQRDERLDPLFDALAESDDAQQSRALLRDINQIWVEHPDPEVQQLVLLGSHLLQVGARREATGIFEMVTRLAPDYAEGWNRLATSLYYRGLNAEALEPTQQTLALEPRHYGAIWGIAMIHRSLGQEDMARRYFQLAFAIAPGLPEALMQAESSDGPGAPSLSF